MLLMKMMMMMKMVMKMVVMVKTVVVKMKMVMMVIGMKMMEMMKMKMKMVMMVEVTAVMMTKMTDDGDKDEGGDHEEPETSCGSFWSQLRLVSKETKQASFLQKTQPLPRKALCLEKELGSVGKVGSRGGCRHQAAWLGPSLCLDLLLCKAGW